MLVVHSSVSELELQGPHCAERTDRYHGGPRQPGIRQKFGEGQHMMPIYRCPTAVRQIPRPEVLGHNVRDEDIVCWLRTMIREMK